MLRCNAFWYPLINTLNRSRPAAIGDYYAIPSGIGLAGSPMGSPANALRHVRDSLLGYRPLAARIRFNPIALIRGDGTGFSPRLLSVWLPSGCPVKTPAFRSAARIYRALPSPRLTLARCPACSLIPLLALVGASPNRKRLGIFPGNRGVGFTYGPG